MKTGDVVRLKSGGPFMTVRGTNTDNVVSVEWFESDGSNWHGVRKDSFLLESLVTKTEIDETLKSQQDKNRAALNSLGSVKT